MRNKKGFTMVELLVVLVIVAILAAVATPIYLANVKRSRASEAVSTMALIRQGQRDYKINGNSYFDIGTGSSTGTVTDALPQSVAAGTPTPADSGVDILPDVAQYFATTAFTVDATLDANYQGLSGKFTDPDAVDFVITARGEDTDLESATAVLGENNKCVGAAVKNCATKAEEVTNYMLEMDNSGRTFVCYDWNGTDCDTNWSAY